MQRQGEFAESIAKRIGRSVEGFRTAGSKRMTVQALADQCAELGVPMDRSVIAKLEKGLRQTITVGEVLVLAKALQVSPLQLVFPIGQADEVEALPGVMAATWDAARWFMGEVPPPGDIDDELVRSGWREGVEPVQLYREHDRLINAWRAGRQTIAYARPRVDRAVDEFRSEDDPLAVDQSFFELAEQGLLNAEGSIRAVRAQIRRRGLTVPPLPPELRHLAADEGFREGS